MAWQYAIGLDFGTESARVLVVDIKDGRIVGQAAHNYEHGVIDQTLPGSDDKLPPDYALQHPRDWLASMGIACRAALAQAKISPDQVVGIGVDFTSCTMLPCLRDGTPLCCVDRFRTTPLAWPKLWKHHGAKAETDRINETARRRKEKWLARYGGIIGIEWFFPKVLETLNHEPKVYDAAEVWIEGGDWLVWQLVAGPFPHCASVTPPRSTCQAGYKAMWNAHTGYPSREYFRAVHPKMAGVVTEKMPGTLLSPGQQAGLLTNGMADLLGVRAGIPISAAIIDAHAGVPGAGVASHSSIVLVMGTSSCHMMNSRIEKLVPGVAWVVEGGILPGFFGYETGQASVGDAFAWVAKTLNLSHQELNQRAARLPPGSGGVLALDWLNGCRTPLMDGRLSGSFAGITLNTRPEQLYRAMMEATAFGVRWIVQTLRDGGVPVRQFVASGGLPAKSPLLMQIYADVLNARIALPETDQSVALGAAILGCIAAGSQTTGYRTISDAIHAMSRLRTDLEYKPDPKARKQYDKLYALYRELANTQGAVANVMRQLRQYSHVES
ncbi:MAG: ribulokinase [Planctomycetota bacterium]|nr:ribulokinase [Planctomycetota bacterium]